METPRKFITAVINLRGVSTNKTIICFIAMQTYKEHIKLLYSPTGKYNKTEVCKIGDWPFCGSY